MRKLLIFYYAVWGCAYYYKDGKHSCKIQLSLIKIEIIHNCNNLRYVFVNWADSHEEAADVNGDGKITITDAVQIINIILQQ